MTRRPGDWLLRTGALKPSPTLDVYRPDLTARTALAVGLLQYLAGVGAARAGGDVPGGDGCRACRPRDIRSRRGWLGSALTAPVSPGWWGCDGLPIASTVSWNSHLVERTGTRSNRDEIRRPAGRTSPLTNYQPPGALRLDADPQAFRAGQPTSRTDRTVVTTCSTSGAGPTSRDRRSACAASGSGRCLDHRNKQVQAYPLMSHLAGTAGSASR